jgi:heme exporter protein C
MIQFLRKTWWKYTAALLLVYALIGGLLVPLAPGIISVNQINIPSGTNGQFMIKGYHTHFLQAKDMQVWFKPTTGTKFYNADSLFPISDSIARIIFNLPKNNFKDANFEKLDLVANDSLDGTMTTIDMVQVTAREGDTAAAKSAVTPEVYKSKLRTFMFPFQKILYQTIRNTFYHVPMWFAMMFLLIFSLVYSIRYLRSGNISDDILASQAINAALLFGALGLLTGMMWANYTWGSPWPNDPKLNGAAVGMIIYLAYIVLRGSLTDEIKRAKISAVYNVFAIVIFTLFIFIIPRLTDSLHPGNGGNPAFGKMDMDNHLRMFFYPAVIGWALLGFWIMSIAVRMKLIEQKRSLQ